MDPIKRNLNLIRLQGTAEQLEETRLLFLELMNESNEEPNSGISPTNNIDGKWLDQLDEIMVKLNEHQINLLEDFLEQLANEITSSRERDITLI
ncbi:MAG: hypothetical protein G3M70_02220 [Candidatus Nitronauta litoralis]|uniref:Uncharacterized protein n=1 Tax=Candidatus Nitronauta litoralis TaxID=2705533 RepID=A0A7T0FZF7_9BACT|nr:MAG: hypothetical protein G3M70_02220 [Candidatus Nitronauta litoralis]